ncbi:MAG: hypothetical protein QXY62_05860 [Candidatus Altiarchaeota archaeon]
MDLILTKKILEFLEVIHKKQKVTGKDYKGMPIERFWAMTRYLRNNGLIKIGDINDRNEKVWVLTEKGKRFAELSLEIKKLLDENGEVNGNG